MPNQRRAIATAFAGILILMFNIIDAADRGSSVWNFLAIAVGVFLLFDGFTAIVRNGNQGNPPDSPA